MVTTVMKINVDLERIADLAVNIGERAQSLESRPSIRISGELDKMSEEAISMVHDAFVRLDIESASIQQILILMLTARSEKSLVLMPLLYKPYEAWVTGYAMQGTRKNRRFSILARAHGPLL